MVTKFRTAYGEKLKVGKDFDHTKIFFKRAGQKVNIYDLIQAGREDTEIYPTLEKYGIVPSINSAAEFFKNNGKGFYAEFEKTMNNRDYHELMQGATEQWENLPLSIREKFHNNKEEFMTNGLEWLDSELKKIERIQNAANQPNDEKKPSEVAKDEQK